MAHNTTITDKAIIGDVPFFYEISGEGHPLVLVHSGVADMRQWDEQVAVFAQHYRVLRYDLRGYGKTPPHAGSFSNRNDLYNLLQFLGIEQTYLLGCSLGGITIIDFALEHPEMVDALILVTTTPSGFKVSIDPADASDEEVLKLQQEHEAAIKRGDIAKAAAIEAPYWLTGPRRTIGQVDPALLTRLIEMNTIALTNKIAHKGDEQPLEPPAIQRLHEIDIPTLVVVGEMDDPNLVRSGELLATSIPNAQKVLMTNTAHFPNMEWPAEFNQHVLDFLAHL